MHNRGFFKGRRNRKRCRHCFCQNTLSSANLYEEHMIKSINTRNEDIRDFLFTLGCYEGERVTIVSTLVNQYIIVVKDARYSIDRELADCIIV